MKRVQVLLSSYNGASYIQNQLDSIFNQKNVQISCLVRDDGSTDATINILVEYQKREKDLELILGENIGYGASFLELIKRSGDYDYYAFSDQDDHWEPLKIINAINGIITNGVDVPIMYCSNCTIVDSNLNKTGILHSTTKVIPEKKITALVQGFAQGCTMVFNRKSKDMVLMFEPEQSYAHDFWVPLLHVFLGEIVYDPNSYLLYRQHTSNVFGGSRSMMKLIRIKLGFLKQKKNYYSRMADELISGYGEHLDLADYQQIKEISDYKSSFLKRMKLLFNKDIKRKTIRGTIILRSLILLSKF